MKKILLLFAALLFAGTLTAQIVVEIPEAFLDQSLYKCPPGNVLCQTGAPELMIINDNIFQFEGFPFEWAAPYQVADEGFEKIRVWGVLVTLDDFLVDPSGLEEPDEPGLDFLVRIYEELTWDYLVPTKTEEGPIEFLVQGVVPEILGEVSEQVDEGASLHFTLMQIDLDVPPALKGRIPAEGWIQTSRLQPELFLKYETRTLTIFTQVGLFSEEATPENPASLMRLPRDIRALAESADNPLIDQLMERSLEVEPFQQEGEWMPTPFQPFFALSHSSAIPLKSLSIALALVLMAGFAWFRLR